MNFKNNQKGIAHLAVIAALAAMLVAGAGVYVVNKSSDKKQLNSQSQQTNLPEVLPEDLLAVEKIKELAQAEKQGATVTAVELENEDGVLVFQVELADGSKLIFNARSGILISKTINNEKEEVDEAIPAGFVPTITFAKAKQIALAKKPGGVVQKIELEVEGSVVVFSVRFTDEARVDVNATTGAVVRTKPAKTNSTSGSGDSSRSPDSSVLSDDDSDSEDDSSSSGSSSSGSGSSGSGSSGSSGDND